MWKFIIENIHFWIGIDICSGLRNGNVELHPRILTVEDFQDMAFVSILSLEMTEGMTLQSNDGKKLLSGLSSEQLPISCVYTYSNNAGSFNNKQKADINPTETKSDVFFLSGLLSFCPMLAFCTY